MSLKGLIKGQSIIIDDHKRGNGEIKNWDSPAADIHIDKKTNFPFQGKRQDIRIKVPLNSDRPLVIENNRKDTIEEIPSQLRKEIKKAFENKNTRESFITEVIHTLKNFDTILTTEDRVKRVVSNLSKHFDLKWDDQKITKYSNDVLTSYTQLYKDDLGKEYFITIEKDAIEIGENSGYAKRDV